MDNALKSPAIKNHDQISVARHIIEFVTDVTAPTTGEQLTAISNASEIKENPAPFIQKQPEPPPVETSTPTPPLQKARHPSLQSLNNPD